MGGNQPVYPPYRVEREVTSSHPSESPQPSFHWSWVGKEKNISIYGSKQICTYIK